MATLTEPMDMHVQQAGSSPSKSGRWAVAATEEGIKVHLYLDLRKEKEPFSPATCHQLPSCSGLTSNPSCCLIRGA